MQDERGLTDSLLDDSLDVESLILGTDINSLTVLPAGRPTAAATELIASSRMNDVVARLARHPRRLVVLDSPPLLISSEARALVQIPAQLVLVARAHHTEEEIIRMRKIHAAKGRRGAEILIGILQAVGREMQISPAAGGVCRDLALSHG